ncbi:MAG TPA: hypothetical protein VEX86_06745 [Longimicrobium sp.]|nr:hypothetical protein [Longimicrobium sp.]
MTELSHSEHDPLAHERQVRDWYAQHLQEVRPHEQLVRTEARFIDSRVRADMRTVDRDDVIREWEFKLVADYAALGQILTYVALARKQYGFERKIRGVIAAFEFSPEFLLVVEVMNLGLELLHIPHWMRNAGFAMNIADPPPIPKIIRPGKPGSLSDPEPS